VLEQLPLDLLQFHGDENAVYCEAFRRPWIKAARVMAGTDLLEYAGRFRGASGVTGMLLDAHVEGYGGGGQTFDWSLIPAVTAFAHHPFRRPASRQRGGGRAQGPAVGGGCQ
jgi:phosphoribosylanthranilate isomerase